MSFLPRQLPRLRLCAPLLRARPVQRLNSTSSTPSTPSSVAATTINATTIAQPNPVPISAINPTAKATLTPLSKTAGAAAAAAPQKSRQKRIIGRVVAAGRIPKTVTVEVKGQKWNSHIRKNFSHTERYLVHNEEATVVEGDVVSLVKRHFDLQPPVDGGRVKPVNKNKRFEIGEIVTPYGTSVEDRLQSLSGSDK